MNRIATASLCPARYATMLPPYPPSPTPPGTATQHASIAPTAASTALPPRSSISRPASAAAGWGVATAAVLRLGGIGMLVPSGQPGVTVLQ